MTTTENSTQNFNDVSEEFNNLIKNAITIFKTKHNLKEDMLIKEWIFQNEATKKFITIKCNSAEKAQRLQNYVGNHYWMSTKVPKPELKEDTITCRGKSICYLERGFVWDLKIKESVENQQWSEVFSWFFHDDFLSKKCKHTKKKFLEKIHNRATEFLLKISDIDIDDGKKKLKKAYQQALTQNNNTQNMRKKIDSHKKRKKTDNKEEATKSFSTQDDAQKSLANTSQFFPEELGEQNDEDEEVYFDDDTEFYFIASSQPSLGEKKNTAKNPRTNNDNHIATKKIRTESNSSENGHLIELNLLELESMEKEMSASIDNEKNANGEKKNSTELKSQLEQQFTILAQLYEDLIRINPLSPSDKATLESIAKLINNFRNDHDGFLEIFNKENPATLEKEIQNIIKHITVLERKIQEAQKKRKIIASISLNWNIFKELRSHLDTCKKLEETLQEEFHNNNSGPIQ